MAKKAEDLGDGTCEGTSMLSSSSDRLQYVHFYCSKLASSQCVLWTQYLLPPLNSYVKALFFNVVMFGGCGLWEVIGRGHGSRMVMMRLVPI